MIMPLSRLGAVLHSILKARTFTRATLPAALTTYPRRFRLRIKVDNATNVNRLILPPVKNGEGNNSRGGGPHSRESAAKRKRKRPRPHDKLKGKPATSPTPNRAKQEVGLPLNHRGLRRDLGGLVVAVGASCVTRGGISHVPFCLLFLECDILVII